MKHMKKTNQLTKRIMSLLLAIVLLIAGIRPITVHATTTMTVETINFKDFSNWRTGMYHYSTGKYCVWPTRVCLNDYVTVDGGEYRVSVKDSDYHLLIRELDKNKIFIKSNDLANGQLFKPSTNTAYLGISIYKTIYESSMSYDAYKTLFTKGFYAGLESTGSKETNADTPSDSSGNENNKTESDTTENNSTVIEKKVFDVAKIDYKDFSNWRSGMYHYATGKHCVWSTRICLNDYVTIDGGEYRVCVKDSGYHLLIRELDKNKAFIKSYNLADGESYTPSKNAAYLGISIYKTIYESSMSYDAYKTLFAKGFYAGLEVINNEETNTETPSDSDENSETESDVTDNNSTATEDTVFDVVKIDYKDFSNWRTGAYHNVTGKYCVSPTRICLNDYVTVDGGKYKVSVKDTGYHLLIRELDKDKAFIKSYNLANGESYTPSTNAAYLGIGVYKTIGESSISYDTFKTLFANGFYAGLEVVEEEEIVEEEEQILDSSNSAELDNGTVKDNDTLFKEELLKMLTTGDTTSHNIAKYGYDWKEVSELYYEVVNNEGRVAYNSCYNMYYVTTKDANGLVQTFQLKNIDSEYLQRYRGMKNIIDNLVQQSKGMSELEKVVFVHDYVVSHCSYSNTENIMRTAAGALLNGKAQCIGYSRAMAVVLNEMGVEAEVVIPNDMTHAWVKVKVNGHWYHADPTWDDSSSGRVLHKYLLRTDDEFSKMEHYGWGDTISTDRTFTNWEIHDIVGAIEPSNNSWYYTDANTGIRKEIVIK